MRQLRLVWLFFALIPIFPSTLYSDQEKNQPPFVLTDYLWNLKRFGSYRDYFRFLKEQGYSGLNLEVIDSEGSYYFDSAFLKRLGWIQEEDLLNDFLKEWRENLKTLELYRQNIWLDFSALSRRFNKVEGKFNRDTDIPSTREVRDMLLEVHERYQLYELSSEPFTSEYQSSYHWDAHLLKKKFNLIVASPAFDRYLHSVASFDKDLDEVPMRFVAQERALYPVERGDDQTPLPTVGLGDIVFALGRSIRKEVWSGFNSRAALPSGAEHNLFLYRALQYAPEGFMSDFVPNRAYAAHLNEFNFGRDIKKDILEFCQPVPPDEIKKRPVANLILSAQPQGQTVIPQYIEPITNALLANGYEIKVTFGQFLKGAELYYLVNSDDWPENIPFFDELLELLDHRKSRFYGKVILHPHGEILSSGRWKTLRKHFNIPSTEEGWIENLPVAAKYETRPVLWRGTVPAERYGMNFIRAKQVRDNFGEVLLSELFEGETLALVIKSGNHFLINGNFLHLEAGYFLSNLLNGALQTPVLAYVTSDKNRTAAFAVADTNLKLKIPSPEVPEQWRVVVFDAMGQKVRDEIRKGEKIFEVSLKAYELVLLLPI